ncbi:MAG: hypothetical protein Q4G33_01775 [bacterium]|nr:hypothetical protein [bacterium]
MKLYKALCITGAVTMIAMITALVMNMIKSMEDTAVGKVSVILAFIFAAVFTVMFIAVVIKHIIKNRRK